MQSSSQNGIVTIPGHPSFGPTVQERERDAPGKAWIFYHAPACRQASHGLPLEPVRNLALVEALASKAAA